MKNFYNWLKNIEEMSIKNFELLGKWGPEAKRQYGYSKQDVGILENPKGKEKILKKWSNSKQDFNLYFVRSFEAQKFRELGERSSEWIKENIGIDIQPDPHAITIVFTQNTGTEKIPMTAWAIAHRVSHAIKLDSTFMNYFTKRIEKELKYLISSIYGLSFSQSYWLSSEEDQKKEEEDQKKLLGFVYKIGIMKSAREENLVTFGEFIHELVAQYIITGKIRFNSIPKSFIIQKRFVYGNPNNNMASHNLEDSELEEYNDSLYYFGEELEHNLDTIFNGLEDKIFVM